MSPPARGPVGARDAHADRPVGGEGRPHRLEHLHGEAHPVFQAAAVGVVPAVAQGGEELVQQVAVGGVDLDGVQPQPCRPPRRLGERVADVPHPVAVQGDGRVVALREGSCGRRDGLPAPRFARPDLLAALPGHPRRGLAAGVGELDRQRHVGIAPHDRQYPPQRRFRLVGPQAEVVGADPPFRHHRGRLQGQQRRPGQGQVAQVDDVPVGGAALVGRILAHRRDHDAVTQRQRADAVRGEQDAHGFSSTRGRKIDNR